MPGRHTATSQDSEKPWKKTLWKRQNCQDNYTDRTFLQHLVINASVPPRSYWPVALASTAVTQQLSCVVAAAAVPLHLHAGRLGVGTVLLTCGLLLALGYGTCALLGGQLLGGSVARGVRQCLLLVGGVYGLAPLLRSLAATTSTDSIVALAVAGGALHLALYDYAFITPSGLVPHDPDIKLTGALSLSCAVMSAVLLASRMRSELEVFAQVLLSLELFLLSPYVRRHVKRHSLGAHLGLTAAMVAGTAGLLLPASPTAAAIYGAAVVVVTFAVPASMVRAHKFKAKISGPWDEAAPYIPRELVLQPRQQQH
ncbi:hypothetical protein VOLCADRAFT_87448 [Volvox carteri f. nagariensis]|uniref:Phosphatidylinositol N-acetylglucosaminyltransferase subunit C n=1 Tax=Volvox carteri f. nagariensis TaxID=3068 RepID=D8TLD2_VOLCA|nr:uncharacterized protein VOLCADRAFT_87448 [Volvox carteri f. nagariensis]EFJ51854.1 hypothetical protein VOLCADRAFT_87448 [Volvox carteri f. nagariensis]|eukprot:XP_002947264.1 hypothetical protein VOLCADRAFT_87448 [Volvox carteri f. nagariensis]